ncbi:COG3650 family protein [Sphingobium sp.]|uniref:COG3650 family protein n=1 Tax=Sphingobium sp. TaxID=1912891 RepID=UPI003BB696B6
MIRVWPLPLVLLLAACGKGDDAPVADNAQPESTSPIIIHNIVDNSVSPENHSENVPRETATPRPAPAAAPVPSPKPRTGYHAIGTEPFWAVTVIGSTATLERPDKDRIRFAVSRSADPVAIRYQGNGFAMTLTPGPCSDGMSDSLWSDRVAVAFGEGTLKGCGGVREDMPGAGR